MKTLTITRTINASKGMVPAVLDDFGNIADWSTGVRRSALAKGVADASLAADIRGEEATDAAA